MNILKEMFVAMPLLMGGPTPAVECSSTLTLQMPQNMPGDGQLLLDVTIGITSGIYVVVTADNGTSIATVTPFVAGDTARYAFVIPATAIPAKTLTLEAYFIRNDISGPRPQICLRDYVFKRLDQ